jgi:hypothetical protein
MLVKGGTHMMCSFLDWVRITGWMVRENGCVLVGGWGAQTLDPHTGECDRTRSATMQAIHSHSGGHQSMRLREVRYIRSLPWMCTRQWSGMECRNRTMQDRVRKMEV